MIEEINFTDLPDDNDGQEEDEYLTEADRLLLGIAAFAPPGNRHGARRLTAARSRDEPPRALPFSAGHFLARRTVPRISNRAIAALACPYVKERRPTRPCHGKNSTAPA